MAALDDEEVDGPDKAREGDGKAGAESGAESGAEAGVAVATATQAADDDDSGREPADAKKDAGDAAVDAEADGDVDGEADGDVDGDADAEDTADDADEVPPGRPRLTRAGQARRTRAVTSGVVMLAVAAALVIRLGSAPSLLTVGLYGIALILSGTAIVLSRRGRTRVATGVLACGFVLVILAEQMLPDAS